MVVAERVPVVSASSDSPIEDWLQSSELFHRHTAGKGSLSIPSSGTVRFAMEPRFCAVISPLDDFERKLILLAAADVPVLRRILGALKGFGNNAGGGAFRIIGESGRNLRNIASARLRISPQALDVERQGCRVQKLPSYARRYATPTCG